MEDTQTAVDAGSTPAEAPAEVVETQTQPEAVADAGSTPAESKPEGETEPEEWRNFVGKYGGDKARAGKAYWETQNYATQTRRENETLKATLDRLNQLQPTKAEPEEVPPDIQALDAHLKGLTDLRDTHPKKLEALGLKAIDLEKEIARCEARLELVGDNGFERDRIEQQLRLARLHLAETGQRFRDAEGELPRLKYEISKIERERTSIQRSLESEKARQAQAQEETARRNAAFPEEVKTIISSSIDELKLPKDESVRKSAIQFAYNETMIALLMAKDIPEDQIDVPGLVKFNVQRFKDILTEAKRVEFAQKSEAQLKTANALGQTARPATTTPKTPAPRPTQGQNEAAIQAELDQRMANARKAFVGR